MRLLFAALGFLLLSLLDNLTTVRWRSPLYLFGFPCFLTRKNVSYPHASRIKAKKNLHSCKLNSYLALRDMPGIAFFNRSLQDSLWTGFWTWHCCDTAWENTFVCSYSGIEKLHFWWQEPFLFGPFPLASSLLSSWKTVPLPQHHCNPVTVLPDPNCHDLRDAEQQRCTRIILVPPPDQPCEQAKYIWASASSPVKQP